MLAPEGGIAGGGAWARAGLGPDRDPWPVPPWPPSPGLRPHFRVTTWTGDPRHCGFAEWPAELLF